MDFLKPVEDTKESLIWDLSLNISGILGASAISDSTGIAAAIISRIGREVGQQIILPLTSRNESKRLYQWGKLAAEGIGQRLKDGEEFRKDRFFKKIPTNRSNFEEVVESTLKKVMDTTEEPKVKFMAKLTENVHFDEDLDMDTYRQILKDLDELTYRQLCIIRLVRLCEDKEVDMISIDEEEEEKWIEQMSQDEQTRFYFISREYENLANNKYFEVENPIRASAIQPPLLLLGPNSARTIFYTHQLHSFANLNQIPIEDIEETFSLWNVKERTKP